MIPDLNSYDRILQRKHNWILEGHVSNDSRRVGRKLLIDRERHFNVERPGQNDQVLKSGIAQKREGTEADPELRAGLQRRIGQKGEKMLHGSDFSSQLGIEAGPTRIRYFHWKSSCLLQRHPQLCDLDARCGTSD